MNKLTKGGIIKHALEKHDLVLDPKKTKNALLRELEDFINPVVEIIEKPIDDNFKPSWSPTYRNKLNGGYYQPLTTDVIVAWNLGRRDTSDLKTIEYWVNKNGSLTARDSTKNGFIALR